MKKLKNWKYWQKCLLHCTIYFSWIVVLYIIPFQLAGKFLYIPVLGLSFIGMFWLHDFSSLIMSKCFGRKKVTCYLEITEDLIKSGLDEDKAIILIESWIRNYDIKEKVL